MKASNNSTNIPSITIDTSISDSIIRGYVDIAFVSYPDTRKSRTSYIFFLAGGLIA